MRASCFSTSFFAIFLILYSSTAQIFDFYPHTANLSTTWTTIYSTDEPMLFRETDVANFVYGFFCEGICTSYVFAIYISGSYSWKYEVVWSANRDYPVTKNAILNFTAVGELVLKDDDGTIVWTTNTVGKSVAGMNLTDTGNLVLFDIHTLIVWQSFDNPTDCLLLGQKLNAGQTLKSSVSSANLSEGMFSLQVTDRGLYSYIESNPPQAYYGMLVLSNATYKGRRFMRFLNGSLSFFIDSSKPSDPDGVIDIPQASSTQYMKLMPDVHLQVFEWQSHSQEWTVLEDLTARNLDDSCNYPLTCGRNSICLTNQQCSCPGIEYFRHVKNHQPNLGCSEINPLTCNSLQDHFFITLENIRYFTLTPDMTWVDMETCKQACLNKCSCKAAFFQYYSDPASGFCFLTSEIFTLKNVDPPDLNYLAFLKVQNVTSHRLYPQVASPRLSPQVARVVGSAIGSFVLLLVVVIAFITYIVHKRKRNAEIDEGYIDQVPGMPNRFAYEELKTATKNFSKTLW